MIHRKSVQIVTPSLITKKSNDPMHRLLAKHQMAERKESVDLTYDKTYQNNNQSINKYNDYDKSSRSRSGSYDQKYSANQSKLSTRTRFASHSMPTGAELLYSPLNQSIDGTPQCEFILNHIQKQPRQNQPSKRLSPPHSPNKLTQFELIEGMTTIRSFRSSDLATVKYYYLLQLYQNWHRLAIRLMTSTISLSLSLIVWLTLSVLGYVIFGFSLTLLTICLFLDVPILLLLFKYLVTSFIHFQNDMHFSALEQTYVKEPRSHFWVATLNEQLQVQPKEVHCQHSLSQLGEVLFPTPSAAYEVNDANVPSVDKKVFDAQCVIATIALAPSSVQISSLSANDQVCEICQLFVHPSVRHRWFGSHLLLTAESFARSKGYSHAVLFINKELHESSLEFFLSHEYIQHSIVRDWRANVNHVIMMKKL